MGGQGDLPKPSAV